MTLEMNKRNDIQIYVLAHKEVPYGIPDNSLYSGLQVGYNPTFLPLRDNTGENISEYNKMYAETTGLLWIRNNRPETLKYIGVCQYRRRLEFPEDTDFDNLFQQYRLITAEPAVFPCSLYVQYSSCHSKKDMDLLKEIIDQEYPEYSDVFESVIMKGNILFYSNGMIMPSNIFDGYCGWLFGILNKFRERKGWVTVEDNEKDIAEDILRGDRSGARSIRYQQQVLGFLSERLFTLWAFTNFPPFLIKTVPYHKMEIC